ncbi:hypothetical protein AB4K20DRAFT_1987824 [Rhizopus microsporus]|uniref:Uncharacterized protein n=1 Tax=Rhizopus microsporus TaxID=58291 RepID=A0A1X0SG34_RHIZD|nr:hypothetical protein BCV71DRAFT_252500 [Rhizopus microsporus]
MVSISIDSEKQELRTQLVDLFIISGWMEEAIITIIIWRALSTLSELYGYIIIRHHGEMVTLLASLKALSMVGAIDVTLVFVNVLCKLNVIQIVSFIGRCTTYPQLGLVTLWQRAGTLLFLAAGISMVIVFATM